jgi:hypothetical protein
MFNVCLPADSKTSRLNAPNTELHSILRHDFGLHAIDVDDEVGQIKHSIWYFGLELGISCEHDRRLYLFGGQELEQVSNSAQMKKILKDWILELRLSPVDDLRPPCLFGVRKDPAAVVLRLDHESAKARDEDVVDLCCAVAERQSHMVEQVEARWWEVRTNGVGDELLSFVLVPPSASSSKDKGDSEKETDPKRDCELQVR